MIRTRDRNKSELLRMLRDADAFGQGVAELTSSGEIEHKPLAVWLDEAPEITPAVVEFFDAAQRIREDIYRAWGVPNLG
jgi:hypothetical protein